MKMYISSRIVCEVLPWPWATKGKGKLGSVLVRNSLTVPFGQPKPRGVI